METRQYYTIELRWFSVVAIAKDAERAAIWATRKYRQPVKTVREATPQEIAEHLPYGIETVEDAPRFTGWVQVDRERSYTVRKTERDGDMSAVVNTNNAGIRVDAHVTKTGETTFEVWETDGLYCNSVRLIAKIDA